MKSLASLTGICVLCFIITVTFSATSLPSSDSFSGQQTKYHTYSYTGGTNNYALFQFTYISANDVGQVLMQVKTSASSPNVNDVQLKSYQHEQTTSNTYFDLEGSNLGKRQLVQMFVGGTSTTLHVYLINFNQIDSLSYNILVQESATSSTAYCSPGNTIAPGSIYCSNCWNQAFQGSYCSILNQKIQADNTYTLQLYPYGDSRGNFGTVTIPGSSNKLTLYFKSTDINVLNFIQFKEHDDEVAGLVNYALSGGFNQLSRANTQYSVGITSSGSDISVSFLNLNVAQTSINVWYKQESTSNILLIVLAVLGAVLFIALIIVAVCIVKRMNHPNQLVHPRPSNMSSSMIQSGENVLTVQELQTYFPSVLCKNIFPAEEEISSNNLMNNQSNVNLNTIDRDCVVCLCVVGALDMMKVTYCKHIFHAHCLGEWFKKNRNCPYCRQEFNKKATREHYQALLRMSGKNMLAGVDLVSEIMRAKQAKSSILVEQIKD